jgi:hypothetical protein
MAEKIGALDMFKGAHPCLRQGSSIRLITLQGLS